MLRQKRWLMLSAVIIFLLIRNSAGEVPVHVEVNYVNVAPQMIMPIPDQKWALNTNLTNAFDLDDFFIDDENISYNASFVDNISVYIDNITNAVSFYPEHGFAGVRTVVFTASDGQLFTESNVVTLNVTPDTTPPQWFSPSAQPTNVFQNSIVSLTASWKDDVNLQKFIASVNQDGRWINQSAVEFSGTENISRYSIQISAPGDSIVFWFITAFDTSDNQNSTSVQNLTVKPLPPPPSGPESPTSGGETQAEAAIAKKIRESFTIEPEKGFIVQMIKGEKKVISFKVTNTGNVQSSFRVEITGLEGFDIELSKNNFTLSPGSSTVVSADLNAKAAILPDIYYGSFKVKASYATKEVPIIIELNELRTILDLNMTVIKNTTIFPGSPVFANIQLTNLKDIQPMGVYMYYAITDFSGNILNYSTEQFDFNTRTVTLQKSLTLPSSLNVGTYIFFTRAITNGSIVVGSDYFEVGEKKSFAAIIFDNLWILIFIIILCIVIIMAVIEYRNRRRLRLLNLYMMINELKACIKENNYEEAVKVFVRIKSYYNEPIAESLFENKEQLHDEIRQFADKLDTKLEKSKIALMQKQEEKPAGTQPSDNKKADSVTSATPVPAKNKPREKAVKSKTKPNKKIRKARKHIKDGKKR